MPAVKRPRPPIVPTMVQTSLVGESAGTSQAHARVMEGIAQLEGQTTPRSKVTATLVAGANTVTHGLGRQPTAVHVTPTTASATFSYALTSADPVQAVVTTVGTTQTNATLVFE